ncbi:MAG: hypothetical protein KDC98_06615 [Planctomycetes bacterium]|nr:hypothetical protein [Planctomycetota bacterium]
MLATLILGLFVFQEPAPKPDPGEAEPPKAEAEKGEQAEKPAPKKVIEVWDDRRGKAAAAEFQKALKGKPSMRDRTKALEALATGSSKHLIKPLQAIIEKDKSIVIRKLAAELLGNQPADKANPAIHKLMRSGKVTSYPVIHAELVRSLSRCGYAPKQWAEIQEEFERYYELERVPLQEALLELIIAHKEKQAIPMLLRNIDEPFAADPEAPGNPPAEYWEARWKSWQVWRGKVKDALFALTEQRFSTAAEAREWLKKNPLK